MKHRASLAFEAGHADPQPIAALFDAGEEAAFRKSPFHGPGSDRQRFADGGAQPLADGEGGLRLQVQVVAVEPANATALRLPVHYLLLTYAQRPQSPSPGDRVLRRRT